MSDQFRRFLLDSLGLVAIGTVADVVPLTGENRVFTRFGLRALAAKPGPGVAALLERARIRRRPLRTSDISFGLGPRLNAAGRMADAALAIDLLTSEDHAEARRMADKLERHNTERQKIQRDMFVHAREMFLQRTHDESAAAIVLAHDSWHPGVVGIVASKLVDEFHRPAVLIAIDGGVGRASARSVPGFHMFNALSEFEGPMISFGGHAGAAGFQIAAGQIPALREHIENTAAAAGPALLESAEQADVEVGLGDLSEPLVGELDRLAPHGEGNPRPLFVARGLRVAGRPKLMGTKGRHISFYASDDATSFRAVAFGFGEALYDPILAGRRDCSLLFTPAFDTWTGSGALELRVKDVQLD
jgi:single-stranded-DNA-specific exonuclease